MTEEVKPRKSLQQIFVPLLIVAAIGLAFFSGVMWQKVKNLEKGGTVTKTDTTQNTTPLSVENIKKMAKDLKLNEKQFNKCLDDGQYAEVVKNDITYGQTIGVQGTPAFFINGKFLGGAYPYESFKEIIDLELAGKGKSIKEYSDLLQEAYVDKPDKPRSFDITPKQIELGDSPVLGDANAKITIVEFSDFECPFCARHFTQTYPEIKSNYIDKGITKLIFKNYPLPFHSSAQKAAEAAECAKEQGKFWEMHDKLFTASPSPQ